MKKLITLISVLSLNLFAQTTPQTLGYGGNGYALSTSRYALEPTNETFTVAWTSFQNSTNLVITVPASPIPYSLLAYVSANSTNNAAGLITRISFSTTVSNAMFNVAHTGSYGGGSVGSYLTYDLGNWAPQTGTLFPPQTAAEYVNCPTTNAAGQTAIIVINGIFTATSQTTVSVAGSNGGMSVWLNQGSLLKIWQ